MYRRGYRGDGAGVLALLALAQGVLQLPQGSRPPVTLAVIAAQVCIYFATEHGRGRLVRRFAFSAASVLDGGLLSNAAWARMLGSQWLHLSTVHLGYNMLSFLWKGTRIERLLGSVRYAIMLVCLALLAPLATTALCVAAAELTGSRDWLDERAVGFSGVLFALKTVLNARTSSDDAQTVVYGVPFPTRHVVWAELLLTYLFVPGTSFVGHCGGIIAGLVWLAGLEHAVFGLTNATLGEGGAGRHWHHDSDAAQGPPHWHQGAARQGEGRFYGSGASGYRLQSNGARESDADLARRLQAEDLRRAGIN